MAQLTPEQFTAKYNDLFGDNALQNAGPETLREFRDDVRDTFAYQVDANLHPVAPAVNFDPVTRQLTATHPLGADQLEYTHDNAGFTAYAELQVDDAAHPQAEWRFRVKGATGRNPSITTDSPEIKVKTAVTPAGPGTIKSTDISDSSAAGRALLTAKDVVKQRELLDKLGLIAEQYGAGQPKFDTLFGEAGALAYLLRRDAGAASPAAPTAGQVDDTSDTFSGVAVPGFASFAEYEGFGFPGVAGIVALTAANAYQQGTRIYLKGLAGPLAKNTVGFRVAASGNRPAGAFLLNAEAFTGEAATPTTPGTITVIGTQGSDAITNITTIGS